MKIELQNLGVLKTANFEVGDFTIICGKNNTGKTYAVYALYGFMRLWYRSAEFDLPSNHVEKLFKSNVASIELNEYKKQVPRLIKKACKEYSTFLYKIFASSEKLFDESSFEVIVNTANIDLHAPFRNAIRSKMGKDLIICDKEEGSSELKVTILSADGDERISESIAKKFISDCMLGILCAPLFPNPFISSAERTGAAIFRKELDFARNRLVEEMGGAKTTNIDPLDILNRVYDSYALAVKDNVDFARDYENIARHESFVAKEHPEILEDFRDIIGGEYRVVKNGLYFVTKKGGARLRMGESSSSVRSLLDVGFYLSHLAQRGDMLIVDEPELNLHPENQRKVARLFARLVNIGLKVLVTTHSDYIIKELNTLIMLNGQKEPNHQLMVKYGYTKEEMLSPDHVKAYSAKYVLAKLAGKARKSRICTFVPCDIDHRLGIEVKGFDDSITEMDQIQTEILFAKGD